MSSAYHGAAPHSDPLRRLREQGAAHEAERAAPGGGKPDAPRAAPAGAVDQNPLTSTSVPSSRRRSPTPGFT